MHKIFSNQILITCKKIKPTASSERDSTYGKAKPQKENVLWFFFFFEQECFMVIHAFFASVL